MIDSNQVLHPWRQGDADVAERRDMLTGLDALVERAGQEEQELRSYLQALSDRLQTACSLADIYCASDNLRGLIGSPSSRE